MRGRLQVPGDKSISHRALIFSLLAKGTCEIYGLSPAVDCLSTAECIKQLGIAVERRTAQQNGRGGSALLVSASGLGGLRAPSATLFAGNSGTTMRLLSGLLAGCRFVSTLDGDESLRQRPMARVLKPLAEMGAQIKHLDRANYAPFSIGSEKLVGREFILDVASAQVQTALLLAGLQAEGKTSVAVPGVVRDHTLKMFDHIAVPYEASASGKITVSALPGPLAPFKVEVPGDISSAAFFMVAAACLPNSELTLTNLVLNKGRCLVIEVLKEMGANLEITNARLLCGEPVADVLVRYEGRLSGATIDGGRLASGIDEIPALALAGALCDGVFTVRDAAELRVKESDRIQAIVSNLAAAGADIHQVADGFYINGKDSLKGGSSWLTYEDHRMAMSGLVAGLLAAQPVVVDNETCVAVSYPDFAKDLARVTT